MIYLHYSNGKVFVWKAEDALIIRKEHRIIGSLVGCYPSKTFQNQNKWLPLQLLHEEAKLLINKGVAQLVSIPENIEDPTIQSFYDTREKLFEEQIALLKENRRKEILEKADMIYEGKKRKFLETVEKKKKLLKTTSESNPSSEQEDLSETKDQTSREDNSNSVEEFQISDKKDLMESDVLGESESQSENIEFHIDKNAVIEAELAKVSDVPKEICMVQLFTEMPWKSEKIPVNWKYPSTESEKIRFAVFNDLWEKGYYITTGTKFGGDFLAYEGDPLKYHALFIVVCVEPSRKLQGSDIIMYGRLGHQVRKTVVLASLNEEEVDYISITWEREVL